jgi:hypothetical protein
MKKEKEGEEEKGGGSGGGCNAMGVSLMAFLPLAFCFRPKKAKNAAYRED